MGEWSVMRKLPMVGLVCVFATPSHAQDYIPDTKILRSLPSQVQKEIGDSRNNCIRGEPTKGDDGLVAFTLSGSGAVLVDDIDLCVNESGIGVNFATGYSHQVNVYVRMGNTSKKALSRDVTGPIFLDVQGERFRALVVKFHAGEKECPTMTSDPTEWKHRSCAFVLKWDGNKFVYKPL
jgi:hypothetical protein